MMAHDHTESKYVTTILGVNFEHVVEVTQSHVFKDFIGVRLGKLLLFKPSKK
jgi:hypothetical protein